MMLDRFFKYISYGAIFCGFLALWTSGAFGLLGGLLFVSIMAAAWYLEESRWQITERPGTALIVLTIPAYYAAWTMGLFHFEGAAAALPGFLARLILTLSAIKLLQNKSDRDWIFLYLMAFFQILLAAGLSISFLYLAVFVLFIFVMVCAVIVLEMRRTQKQIAEESDGRISSESTDRTPFRVRNVPATAFILIVVTFCFAVPMFFMLPRVGGAGIGATPSAPSTYSGFSDTVRLGDIGRIQQNDEVVMRVRIENAQVPFASVRWRGVALDTFDEKSWSKSNQGKETRAKGDREMIQVDYATEPESLALQTFYLEPLDSPVLFALPRPVGIQGNFPVVYRDRYKSLSVQRPTERISYRAISDFSNPTPSQLRSDRARYSDDDSNYLQVPDSLDARITELAEKITLSSKNRYDAAVAVESYLQINFGYTLEPKAGGDQPLSDFLFNVREGHCEYFSTALAVMLRTQGIATRVVNGFQRGEYNETADVFVVRQKNAHSWVEVYFPGEDAWVTFDGTPAAGRESTAGAAGVVTRFSKYAEALETFWIQYFVAFDNQEQRSLFTSVKRGFTDIQNRTSPYLITLHAAVLQWWNAVRGQSGTKSSIAAAAAGLAIVAGVALLVVLIVWLYRRLLTSNTLRRLGALLFRKKTKPIVEFYDRLLQIAAARGFVRNSDETPLEFASSLPSTEAVNITLKYNEVRFSDRSLSREDEEEIEKWMGIVERQSWGSSQHCN